MDHPTPPNSIGQCFKCLKYDANEGTCVIFGRPVDPDFWCAGWKDIEPSRWLTQFAKTLTDNGVTARVNACGTVTVGTDYRVDTIGFKSQREFMEEQGEYLRGHIELLQAARYAIAAITAKTD